MNKNFYFSSYLNYFLENRGNLQEEQNKILSFQDWKSILEIPAQWKDILLISLVDGREYIFLEMRTDKTWPFFQKTQSWAYLSDVLG